jgi:hypothetical protein
LVPSAVLIMKCGHGWAPQRRRPARTWALAAPRPRRQAASTSTTNDADAEPLAGAGAAAAAGRSDLSNTVILLRRGGGQPRRHSPVNCNHGDSSTRRLRRTLAPAPTASGTERTGVLRRDRHRRHRQGPAHARGIFHEKNRR